MISSLVHFERNLELVTGLVKGSLHAPNYNLMSNEIFERIDLYPEIYQLGAENED